MAYPFELHIQACIW